MALFKKYILPRLLNYGMQKPSFEKERLDVAGAASGNVLEVGFGSGLNLPLYKNISKLYALDPSKESYNLAKERIAKVSFPVEYIQASAEKIPLESDFFDTVVSTWSFCSIPKPELALREIARVLKPTGKFIFVEHGKSVNKFWAKWQDILTPFFKLFSGGCHMNREIEKLLLENGFQILKLEKFPEKYKSLQFTYKGVAIRKI